MKFLKYFHFQSNANMSLKMYRITFNSPHKTHAHFDLTDPDNKGKPILLNNFHNFGKNIYKITLSFS